MRAPHEPDTEYVATSMGVEMGDVPTRKPKAWHGFVCLVLLLGQPQAVSASDWFDWYGITGPCDGDCAFMIFGGKFVETPMDEVFFQGNLSPSEWNFGDSGLLGIAASRRVASLLDNKFQIEAELGLAKRFGAMDEYETWAAAYLRYVSFPWNDYLYTTVAVSTGINYASGIADFEKEKSDNGDGSRLLHYFAPEITFAAPEDKSKELVIRFHHRSGIFGLVNDTGGGVQYLTVGLRFRF
ncbi:hypothetical protein ABIA18_002710 [Sinorhizobium fredii]